MNPIKNLFRLNAFYDFCSTFLPVVRVYQHHFHVKNKKRALGKHVCFIRDLFYHLSSYISLIKATNVHTGNCVIYLQACCFPRMT